MSISYIMSEFGGARGLARALGYPPTTVQNWKDRKNIPSQHQGKILQVAIELGKNIKAEHFIEIPESVNHKSSLKTVKNKRGK